MGLFAVLITLALTEANSPALLSNPYFLVADVATIVFIVLLAMVAKVNGIKMVYPQKPRT